MLDQPDRMAAPDHCTAKVDTADGAPCRDAIVALADWLATHGLAGDQTGERGAGGVRITGSAGSAFLARARHFRRIDR